MNKLFTMFIQVSTYWQTFWTLHINEDRLCWWFLSLNQRERRNEAITLVDSPRFLLNWRHSLSSLLCPPAPPPSTVFWMGFYADISWESRCSSKIKVWGHLCQILVGFEVPARHQVKGISAFLKVECVSDTSRNWLMDLFDIDLNKLPNIFGFGKPFQQPPSWAKVQDE